MHSFDSKVSADFLHSNFDLPPSEFVKIDIDGNEVRNSKDETYLWNTQGP